MCSLAPLLPMARLQSPRPYRRAESLPASGSAAPRYPPNGKKYFQANMLFYLKKCLHTLYSTPNRSNPILHIKVIFVNHLFFFFPQKSIHKMDAPSIKPHKMFLFLNFKHCLEDVHLFQVKRGLQVGNMSRSKLQTMGLKLGVWKLVPFGLHSPLIFISVAYLILTSQ